MDHESLGPLCAAVSGGVVKIFNVLKFLNFPEKVNLPSKQWFPPACSSHVWNTGNHLPFPEGSALNIE